MLHRFVAGPRRGEGGGGTLAPSSLSRAIPLFRCLLCRAFFSAARRSREPHFRLPRDLFPPDSFSRLIGSFQPIYGASQGDRVISFGFENGHHLYRAVANFCQPDGNDDSDRTAPSNFSKNSYETRISKYVRIFAHRYDFYPKKKKKKTSRMKLQFELTH